MSRNLDLFWLRSLFCDVVLSILSSFAVYLLRKRGLIVFSYFNCVSLLSFGCLCSVSLLLRRSVIFDCGNTYISQSKEKPARMQPFYLKTGIQTGRGPRESGSLYSDNLPVQENV